ncbi:purine-nucleoside phosphorylase [Devosia psychrophila]|uniref:Purine nucleoside phosphorylase n=1 Tax=Devosia psychrophila TaxID=728005 RepID=A0A0F5PU66_9HYPH|nr:purine-nucleoside phosphorylase [Devosia psychrophila]KKC32242.1 purine nucleoside phosphorylase [Devosia psychrophila]SFD33541.1 purine-nucleoside phosphorylase [Devosia psychrophila]
MTQSPLARLEAAYASIAARVGAPSDTAIVLGSGLGHLADAVVNPTFIPYGEIAGFPVSTAPGHKGQLVIGDLFGRRTVLMQGRVHLYEGWAPQDVAHVIYLLGKLGPKRLIVTNAAGALNPDYRPGDVMLIEDHLNFTGLNPLTGPNDEAIGVRFPDLSRAYDPALQSVTIKAAEVAGVSLRRGIYVGVAGPSLETSAERRYYRATGADAVGMSTVLEVVAAAHIRLPVIGLSAITNEATGGPDQQPDTIEEVLANAAIAGKKIDAVLAKLLPQL